MGRTEPFRALLDEAYETLDPGATSPKGAGAAARRPKSRSKKPRPKAAAEAEAPLLADDPEPTHAGPTLEALERSLERRLDQLVLAGSVTPPRGINTARFLNTPAFTPPSTLAPRTSTPQRVPLRLEPEPRPEAPAAPPPPPALPAVDVERGANGRRKQPPPSVAQSVTATVSPPPVELKPPATTTEVPAFGLHVDENDIPTIIVGDLLARDPSSARPGPFAAPVPVLPAVDDELLTVRAPALSARALDPDITDPSLPSLRQPTTSTPRMLSLLDDPAFRDAGLRSSERRAILDDDRDPLRDPLIADDDDGGLPNLEPVSQRLPVAYGVSTNVYRLRQFGGEAAARPLPTSPVASPEVTRVEKVTTAEALGASVERHTFSDAPAPIDLGALDHADLLELSALADELAAQHAVAAPRTDPDVAGRDADPQSAPPALRGITISDLQRELQMSDDLDDLAQAFGLQHIGDTGLDDDSLIPTGDRLPHAKTWSDAPPSSPDDISLLTPPSGEASDKAVDGAPKQDKSGEGRPVKAARTPPPRMTGELARPAMAANRAVAPVVVNLQPGARPKPKSDDNQTPLPRRAPRVKSLTDPGRAHDLYLEALEDLGQGATERAMLRLQRAIALDDDNVLYRELLTQLVRKQHKARAAAARAVPVEAERALFVTRQNGEDTSPRSLWRRDP